VAKNPVVYWEINGTVGKKLADFYTGLFEWEYTNEAGSDFYHLESGGAPGSINGGVFTGKGKLPHHLTLYVEVDDVDAYYNKALQSGGTPAQAPFDVPGVGRLGFFRDPDGHIIGLIAPVDKSE
jgi:predicted enzyme related to lactoylglutathione lyase